MKLRNEEFPIFQYPQQRVHQLKNTYLENFSFISRNIFLSHCLSYLFHIKQETGKQNYKTDYGIADSQLKSIQQEEKSQKLYNRIVQQYVSWKEWRNGNYFQAKDVSMILLKTFLPEIIIILALLLIDSLIRLSISIIVFALLNVISQGHQRQAFIYSLAICVSWYLKELLKQQGYLRANLLSIKIKSSLITLLFTKISWLSQYNIEFIDKGKIINLLSSDIESIQQKLIDILKTIIIPIQWLGSTIILIVRVGWPGLMFTCIVILSIPLNIYLSRRNSKSLKESKIYRDKRTQIIIEIIKDIENVKYHGQEEIINRFIDNVRKQQSQHYETLNFGKVLKRIYGHFTGIIIALVLLVAAQLIQQLSQATIFSCLQVILSFKVSLQVLNISLDTYFEKDVVFQRLASILNIQKICMIRLDEEGTHVQQAFIKPQILLNHQSNTGDEIESQRQLYYYHQNEILFKGHIKLQNFSSYWINDIQNPMIDDITYSFSPGKIYGITGKVGSGKTTFLKALINDIPYYSGRLNSNGTAAYIQQEPMILRGTIRSNILYGQQFHKQAYQKIIGYCCLEKTLNNFPNGDEQEIHERGSNISKGQTTQISFARALYKNTDVILIDNLFCNIDKKIADKLFFSCLKQISRQKTIILVTYQIDYLYQCDEIIFLEDGKIKKSGVPADFQDLFQSQMHPSLQVQLLEEQFQQKSQAYTPKNIQMSRDLQIQTNLNPSISSFQTDKQKQVEVTFKSLINFLFQGKNNKIIFIFSFILFIVNQLLITLFFRLLVYDEDIEHGKQNPISNNLTTFWSIQGIIVLIYLLVMFLKNYLFSKMLVNSSFSVYEKMIQGIIRSPVKNIHQVPSGVFINRLSNDLNILDQSASISVVQTLEDIITIITAIVNACQLDVYLIPAVIAVFIIGIIFYLNARNIIFQCKQKSLKNRTKIYSIYEEMLEGITHMKIYNQRQNYLRKFASIVDRFSASSIAFQLVSRGFEFYSTVLAIILMLIGLIVGAIQIGESSPALYSVTAVFLINFSGIFPEFIKQLIKSEGLLLNYERVIRVAQLPSEKPLRTQFDNVIGLSEEFLVSENRISIRLSWPNQPKMKIQNLNIQLRPQSPRRIRNLSFFVERNQKICIFGKTASGKSSIIQTIFRLIEPNNQTIMQIGGFDAKQMGLHSLRKHISIVPQKPSLFKGTIRQNIDPDVQFTDNDIWNVLQTLCLSHHIRNLPQQLQTDSSSLGVGFSTGQRKLLSLAKVLLLNNKLLILDNLTSYFDAQTKAILHKIIRQRLSNITIISCENRINTIIDYDKIFIIKDGMLVSQVTPSKN